ncbi:MAG: NADH-quinone oxidoreductase subunit C, partial [Acidithiobacillales bacterium]
MSAVAAPATLPFAPVLEKRFGGKAAVEPRPAADLPTIAVDRAVWHDVALFLRDDPSTKYDLFLDLASVDTSRLPAAMAPKDGNRFQAHVILYSTPRNAHLRVRLTAPEKDATLASVTDVWPAANWFEREAWDLMGIRFPGHPNLQRLLTHNGFVGHALRKDYEAAQRWLCTEEDLLPTQLAAKADVPEDLFETMTMNLGPSHNATHGTLRVVVKLDGEKIIAAESECGYLHRCFEKMAETHTWVQVVPFTDRLNYCSPMINGFGYARAVEQLVGIEAPPRAQAIRTILSEFNRIMDHQVCIGANLVDLGGLTPFWYAYQSREEIYGLLEACCGARLTSSYARIGGLSADVPANFVEWSRSLFPKIEQNIADVDRLITKNRIAQDRLRGTGVASREMAIAYGFTGPCGRASGIAYDVRKDVPYDFYGEVDFDVPVSSDCDNYARYLVRMEEMRQSLRIIDQVLRKLPGGPVTTDDYRVALP